MRVYQSCVPFGARGRALPETPYRVAVYYAPAADDPLWAACTAWLGRDPETGATLDKPPIAGIFAATSSPRRYGAHATLKPPMRLRGAYEDFVADVERLAAGLRDFSMPLLTVDYLKNFLALCPQSPLAELDAAAARCVTELDHHRLPEDAASQARRAAGRSASELENLARWGYPLVLDDWKFHITLSNAGAPDLLAAAQAYFAPALARPRMFASLAIFCEAEPGGDFRLVRRIKLGG
jgi:hypothetical protein